IARFDSFLQVALVTNYFTSVENFFRIVGNLLHPDLFDEHTPIFTISKKILERFDFKNYACVLDMYRLIRNLSHNNGVYNKEARRFYYDGRVYHFIPNRLVYLNWKLLCDLSIDIEECIFQIINTKTISDYYEIEDPSSYYLL
ncbi:MAG TPA: hypothetical protein VFA69_03825, partial [Candidatus Nitrosotalea sp.]|nr:hypothetical protein [Candidatus Nitrosotalea sp.]